MKCTNGHQVVDSFDPVDGPRRPCPECGTTTRTFEVSATASVHTHASVRFKHHRPGFKRPISEGMTGILSIFRKTGARHIIDRSIHRGDDRYHERIVDADTGEVVREVDEPLSQHRGHGDARSVRNPPGDAQ